ncbi:MAG: PorT family protein [Flavobacterium sp.]|nr:PorT family protein [Flavobacterium sp.]
MKSLKFLAAAAIVFASVSTASAQNEADNSTDRTVSFGVKGGVNFASVTGDDFDSPDSRTSFHVGVLAEFPLDPMFSIQAEVLYSGQGFEYDIPAFVGEDQHVEYQLDYINIPVLAKIYATRGLSFEVGPQFSFKVNEEIDTNPNGDDGDNVINEAESFDFGIAGGVSFTTEMGLFATGRYTYGLTDIVKDVNARNSVFQIGIGYKF